MVYMYNTCTEFQQSKCKWAPVCKYQSYLVPPSSPQGSTRYDAVSLRYLSVIFFSLCVVGDKTQRHSDPMSKSLLGILRDLRIIVEVLANMNQSSRRWRVEVLAWGDFPNACADLVTLFHIRLFLVQLAIGVTGDGRQLNSTGRFRFMHTCLCTNWILSRPKYEEVSFSFGLSDHQDEEGLYNFASPRFSQKCTSAWT
jgi:hypothetical protein